MINTFCIALRRTNRKSENEKRKKTRTMKIGKDGNISNYSSKVWSPVSSKVSSTTTFQQ